MDRTDTTEQEVLFECYLAIQLPNSPLFSLWHPERRSLKVYKDNALDHKRLRQMRGRSMQQIHIVRGG